MYESELDISDQIETWKKEINKKVCSSCGKEIGNNDIVKGFEYEPNKYVTMTESEHLVKPLRVCKVECMEKITSGSMWQPVFKGLRDD